MRRSCPFCCLGEAGAHTRQGAITRELSSVVLAITGKCRSRATPTAATGTSLATVLVLFDLDGTLTDPYEGITQCVTHALDRLGLASPDERGLRAFIGPPLQDQFAALGLDEVRVEQAITYYRDRFTQYGLYENSVYAGVAEALDVLHAAGVRMAVATSKPTEFATRIVQHFGLDAHLEFVAGATLDGTRRAKADIIGFALEHLGASADQSVMVGDRSQDVKGAHAHGMRSIGVAWGYAEPGELQQAGVDLVVASPQDLVASLLHQHSAAP